MFRSFLLVLVAASGFAAERRFDFSEYREGDVPRGFRSTMTGQGAAPDWKVVVDESPLVLTPFSPKSAVVAKRPVLAQLSKDTNESRAPMFVLDAETFADFTFHTRVKIVSGEVEQMAGLAFRVQDERNYYYIRLNAKNQNVAFFRYVEGELIGPVSKEATVRVGEWNQFTVECRGSKLRALLNEKEVLPWTEPNYVPFPDGTTKGVFGAGKIAFWTKADTVAHFTDARIEYTPREPFAQTLVRETVQNNPRLLGLKIYSMRSDEKVPRIIASDKEKDIGEPGTDVERSCIDKGGKYFGRGKEMVVVTMPLHDRNGETVGAVRVEMTTFFGQTEKNALARAFPIVKAMESRVSSGKELLE